MVAADQTQIVVYGETY